MGAQVVTVNDVLDGHVALDIQCLNRIYLNAYIPRLQTSAQVVAFLSGHLGYPFPSPALFNHLGRRFRRAVASYAEANDIPWVQLGKDDDKLAVMRAHLDRQATTDLRGGAGVPAGLGCHPGQDFHRHATVVVLQGRPPGDLLLLLPVGRRFRPRLRQGVCLLPLAGQGLAQRPRVGQTPASASPNSPTGSPPARIHKRCSSSATGSVRHHRRVHPALAGSAAPAAHRHRP